MISDLIVGLGNPGPPYANTRHNLGFWFIDLIAKKFGAQVSFEPKFFGESGSFFIQGKHLLLLKPLTYMNNSGNSVTAAMNFYKISPASLWVVHDELDLPPGKLKLKKGSSHAGHNGIKDIQKKLGSNEFWRLRIGIGHPRSFCAEQTVSDFVLKQPTKEQKNNIEEQLVLGSELLIKEIVDKSSDNESVN